jgi:hypothetical protein
MWAIGTVVILLLGGLGFLGFRSWSDVQERMNKKLAETQAAITTRGEQAIQDTDNAIRQQAEAAFKEDSIKAYVRQVAEEKTGAELTKVIRQAVGDQVAARVKAEEPQINSTVVQETKRAVDNLNPYISSEVQKRTSEALAPLRAQIDSYQQVVGVSTLALLARNGDGSAYDQIEQTAKQTPNPTLREICVSTINEIYVEMNDPFYTSRNFTVPKETPEMEKLLIDPNALVRWAAVDGLADKGEKAIVPRLIDIINRDQSLWVRRAGYQALQRLTGQKFEKLERDQWNSWWQSNKGNWPPK